MPEALALPLTIAKEIHGVELVFAAMLAQGVQRRAQEVGVADAGDLDRVLKTPERGPRARAVFG